MIAKVKQYSENISKAANTIFEGMAVTLSYMVRKPMTVQYPDRIEKPVAETLPERYRGFLEVDMGICSACQACARACPIECIAIDIDKHPEHRRVMTRFDIDLAKCMYCGLCSEACPNGAIRHSNEFEAGAANLANLVFRFVEGDFVVPYKPVKGEDPETVPVGQIARRLIREWNASAPQLPEVPAESPKPAASKKERAVKPRGETSADSGEKSADSAGEGNGETGEETA